MALSEVTNGFNGGSYVDEIPNYTLDEAVNYLPVMIMESQIEQYDMVAAQNELIVEAVVTSAHSGDNSAFESINEAALSGLIERLETRLRRFASSWLVSSLSLRLSSLVILLSLKSSSISMVRMLIPLSARI